jgi:glyoxylase-like metal-dependent hydrolase (beta-lactamase superfamily II)
MHVKQFLSPEFGSNTYLVSDDSGLINWLIDAGNVADALSSLLPGAVIQKLFLTHSHFDHILQVNDFVKNFPSATIYTSLEGKKGLYSDKLNLSFYHDNPVVLEKGCVKVIGDGTLLDFDSSYSLLVHETKGHNEACLSFQIGSFLFTGDSFIPGVKIVTKLKGGSRVDSEKSLRLIRSLIKPDTVVCPGHGSMMQGCYPLSFPDLMETES